MCTVCRIYYTYTVYVLYVHTHTVSVCVRVCACVLCVCVCAYVDHPYSPGSWSRANSCCCSTSSLSSKPVGLTGPPSLPSSSFGPGKNRTHTHTHQSQPYTTTFTHMQVCTKGVKRPYSFKCYCVIRRPILLQYIAQHYVYQ